MELLLPRLNTAIRLSYRSAVGRMVQLDQEGVEKLEHRQVRVSEAFTVQDAAGTYFRASLKSLGGKGAEALVYEEMERSPEPSIRLALFCAVLARQRMMLIVQKATELGVTHIQPLFTEKSVAAEGLEHEKAHAWPNQVLRAVKQCRRAVVPDLRGVVSLQEALEGDLWGTSQARYVLDDRAADHPKMLRGPGTVAMVVGPEGGWSDAEREQLRESGAQVMALGARVLRAETAVLVAVTLAQHRLGDLTS